MCLPNQDALLPLAYVVFEPLCYDKPIRPVNADPLIRLYPALTHRKVPPQKLYPPDLGSSGDVVLQVISAMCSIGGGIIGPHAGSSLEMVVRLRYNWLLDGGELDFDLSSTVSSDLCCRLPAQGSWSMPLSGRIGI